MLSNAKGEIYLMDYDEINLLDYNDYSLTEINLIDFDEHALTEINLMGMFITLLRISMLR